MKAKKTVTIIGFGTMGKAIAKTLTENDPDCSAVGVDQGDSMASVKNSRYVVLAVKPADAATAIRQIKNAELKKDAVIVSIMAGIPLEKLAELSGHNKIIRMMPNLGLSVGHGIAAWMSFGLSPAEKKSAKRFLDRITENFEIKNEDDINKVTAVSGSGPAYFFLLAKSLSDAAEKLGLKKEEAKRLVEKTFSASAMLAKGADYAELIKKIASKGGTTEVALKIFKKEKFEKTVEKAVRTAYERARKLSE
jgi:pyrroline-5-carboxylate reductase